jgi:predicted RNase H-like nuclease (RuvC/YqgF family)
MLSCVVTFYYIKLPKLRKENEALKQENSRLSASLTEAEGRIAESISDLQLQMMTALQAAVEKAEHLQQELDASERKNQELQKLLSSEHGSAGDP